MSRSFVHLHVHTLYSLLDGAIRIKPLVSQVKAMGMPAVAMTDHGNMFGAIEFYKTCKGEGIKPIIGSELNVVEALPQEGQPAPRPHHLTMLAATSEGYRNLMRLSSHSSLRGTIDERPHADHAMIEAHSEGLIALSGDLGGEIPQAILRGDLDEARRVADVYRQIFGRERFYLEVMDNAFPEQQVVNEGLVRLGRELGVELVATNDCHHLRREEAVAHALLMCIQLQKSVALPTLNEHAIDSFYLKSADEMWEAFSEIPQACQNTLKIAEMVNAEVKLGDVYLPQYKVPQAFQEACGAKDLHEAIHLYFVDRAKHGLGERLERLTAQGLVEDPAPYHERLDVELGIIRQMDFPGYFLIVWDFINWSKENGVPVGPGRGSGAGSLVAYALGITDIDPLQYGLLFERFLNPERVSMPDFDIDFCMYRRGEVIDYVSNKYGADNVAMIVTYGSMKARACIKDVGRALNLSFSETNRIAKLVPETLGITLQAALKEEPRLRELVEQDELIGQLYDIALKLEGLYRQTGMHAAGVVISEAPLWEYVPVFRNSSGGEIVSQYAKNEVEQAGLVKFDFLGLKTLTVIQLAVQLIDDNRAARGEEAFDLAAIPMDDAAVFALLSSGKTTGVFQLESSGFQELMVKLRPDCFEDIIAAVALYRPGPLGSGMVDDFVRRKHGEIAVEYPHPWLEEILRETYGVIVYQEQVMQSAQILAGYSLGAADLMRRAMGKKKPEEMAEQRDIFVSGSVDKGVAASKAGEIFDLIEYFSGYGFNKCVVGDTLVMDARTGDRVRVAELFERRDALDFEVHALDEATQRLRARRVTDVVWNGHREVFELRTAQGKRLVATANHPLYTPDGWVNLGDLSPGDAVAAPQQPEGEALDDPRLLAGAGVFWDRVVSVTPAGHEHTFDLTVEGDHNFVADGLIVHNSHSAAYALISYQTAYLKAHHPVEFYAALMSCDRDKTDKVVRTIYDARKQGVQVLPPDVNVSKLDFSTAQGKVRFGLGAVKGIGEGAIETIVEARAKASFEGLYDFCERVDLKRVNRKVLEALVKCGALDGLWPGPMEKMRHIGEARARMLASIPQAIDRGQRAQADRAAGQTSLFSMFSAIEAQTEEAASGDRIEDYAQAEPWTDQRLLALEKETIGFYVTGHPLDRYQEELARYATCDTGRLSSVSHRDQITLAGMVTAMREKPLKSGNGRMAFVTIEDHLGEVEVLCFSRVFEACEGAIKSDQPLLVRGSLLVEGTPEKRSYKVRAEHVQRLTDARTAAVKHLLIELDAAAASEATLRRIEALLREHTGACRAYLRLRFAEGEARLNLPASYCVAPSDAFLMAIERLLGDDAVKMR